VNLSAYKIRKKINAHIIITIISSILSFAALSTLLYYTYTTTPVALVIFIGFVIISLIFELLY